MVDPSALSLYLLAVIQGITEFLPVSSSGHLALAENLLGVGRGNVFDEVLLHLGTLGAVLVFYRKDLWQLVRGIFRRGEEGHEARRYLALLLLGSVPAGLVGVGFADRIEPVFEHMDFVLLFLALTGALLWWSERIPRRDLPLSPRIAVLVGCAQAIAILPGFSRSGWTIVVGLVLGLSPREAARYSFLLSVPAIAGATLLQFLQHPAPARPLLILVLAVTLSFVVGLVCLRWLVRLVQRMSLRRFAYYLWALVLVGAFSIYVI